MTRELHGTKSHVLTLLDLLLERGVLSRRDLARYVGTRDNLCDPETVRQEIEDWYRSLGIEQILDQRFSLSQCPFSEAEIRDAGENNETIICVPKGVTRQQLGTLFRLHTWALFDPLVTLAAEPEDLWFRTSLSLQPSYLNRTGIEIKHLFESEDKIHFSLERYLVFHARVRHLTNRRPDNQYWIWLPHRAYDRSGMLMAGIDRNGALSVHGWMPQFSASFLGARYGLPPKSR